MIRAIREQKGARAETKSGPGKKLDAEAWMDAALDELAAHGIDRVRVEVLARQLNVTKGSFYWHFKDRDALLEQMLQRWRRRATLALIERLERADVSAGERLRQLLRLPLKGERSALAADLELAIRLWGRADPRARGALAEVDEVRVSYIAQLFSLLPPYAIVWIRLDWGSCARTILSTGGLLRLIVHLLGFP